MGETSKISLRNLKNAANISDFMAKNRENMLTLSLAECLTQFRRQRGLRVADVIRASGLTKAYVHQIFNGEKKPSRDKLIALAFGLHLTAEETQRMLKLGGYSELYARVARDAILLFAIQRGMGIEEADQALYDNGFPTLLPEEPAAQAR